MNESINQSIAILIPCYNEEHSISDTVLSFRSALPLAKIYAYDNNSTDKTFEIASKLDCIVRNEPKQGKGAVVRRMFADIDADIYILVDGDNTYDANIAPDLVNTLIQENLDMIIGARNRKSESYPKGHILGNKIFSKIISYFFNSTINDLFSGYRIMTKRFVKSLPLISNGFEIETEMTVLALQLNMPIKEIPTNYSSRKENSKSKLRTYRDGFKILSFIFFLIREQKPLLFFMTLSLICTLFSLITGTSVIFQYLKLGTVLKISTAVFATSMGILAILFFAIALILDSISNARKELKRMNYLNIK
ncbi:glycosyltransferase [Aggregatibacter actinomycetemcomitans]|uniref:glycosyltransferase family 2 protein n=1 Tax=Aggregatibacter actinomycetemcomitans TaxID=714 RepID=UPI0011D8095F|nr:glycosyltransferase family 2 protein [Aggregatibacter actinomycetemcomitans]TYB17934.1 glycosyltransferase [Aggregatibacter actinomycetemcomitans]